MKNFERTKHPDLIDGKVEYSDAACSHSHLSAGSDFPKLGSQDAFDSSDFYSLVRLMRDVQDGRVSCRRAAKEILYQRGQAMRA